MARTPFRITDMRVVGTLAPQTGDVTPPTTPQNVVATAINAGRVDVSWTASTDDFGVSGYQIFRNGSPLTTTTLTSYSDTTCQPSTAYSYVIVAFDAAGNSSSPSAAGNATTPANAAPVWQSIPAQALIVGNSYLLQLTDYCTDADVDTLTFSITNGTLPTGLVLAGNRIQGTPTTAGQSPTITVQAADVFHQISTTIAYTTKTADVTAPPVPTGLAATPISTSQINLSWSASTDVAGGANESVSGTKDYKLYRDGSLRVTQTGTTYSDTGLAAGTQYSYSVSVRDNSLNESAQSTAVLATTQAASSGAPFILFHANTAGPVTGGGAFCFLYVLNPPTFAELMAGAATITIGGVAVAGCCHVANPQAPRLAAMGVKRIAFQVGALTGLSLGTAYPIVLTTASGTSNANDPFGEAITFTPQPGSQIYVALTGVDGAAGDIAHPMRRLQDSSLAVGALRRNGTSASDVAGQVGTPPGTHVVLRGGTYTDVGNSDKWANLYQITGRPATGAASRGPICIMSYPGAVGSNAPELAFWDAPAGKGGGFNGNDSSQANAAVTAYGGGGTRGWCQYIEITGIKIRSSSTGASDAGPINTQNRGSFWRCIDNDLSWPEVNQGFSAGIEGSPQNGRFYGNHIHDISSGNQVEADTNHAFYMDGFGSGTTTAGAVATGNIIAFNDIHDITAGNGVQFFDGVNGSGMANNVVAYNWIKTVSKHCINIADNTKSCIVYNNICEDAGRNALRLSTSGLTAANGVLVANNVFYGWARVAGVDGFSNESTYSGSMRFENNIVMQKPSHSANGYSFLTNGGGTVTLAKNRWYDPDGRLTTKPAADSTGSYGNPSFTAAASGDFTLTAGSACIDTGNTPTGFTRAFGFGLNTAPQGAAHDIGAYER